MPKALFGEKPGHCAEGEWTASASDIMREPGYLTKFHADRALVEKVRLFLAHLHTRDSAHTPHLHALPAHTRLSTHDSPPP